MENTPELTHENALATGTLVQEYRIDRILGHGGFGITYMTTDQHLHRLVALKEYLPQELAVRRTDGTIVAKSSTDQETYGWGLHRFMEEAQTLARFSHPNIVKVHRCFPSNGTAYIAMEYEEGETLASSLGRLTEGEAMSEVSVLQWLEPVLDGLQAVHAQGILHRDLKPENVYLRAHGPAMLIDFGAARYALGSRSKSLSVVLTPGYAPYEQYSRQGDQGPWTDIYSLGAVLYHCLTGKEPIDAAERAMSFLDGTPDPLTPVCEVVGSERGYNTGLLMAIDRAMAVSAKERPPGVAAFRKIWAVETAKSSQETETEEGPQQKPEVVAEPEDKPAPAAEPMPVPPLPAKRAPMLGIAIGIAIAVVGSLVGTVMWYRGDPDSVKSTTQDTRNQPPSAGSTAQTFTPKPTAYGALMVESDPSGAEVHVDGKRLGTAPIRLEQIEAGVREIQILMDGYEKWQEAVEVKSMETVKLRIGLNSSCGELSMASSPGGADVYVDGKYAGRTPLNLAGVHNGEKTVELRLPGYKPWVKSVRVEPLGKAEITASLVEEARPSAQSKSTTITSQEASAFVRDFLRASESRDVYSVLNCYDRSVDYFTSGVVNQEFIRKDKEYYFKRWTTVRMRMIGDMQLNNTNDDDTKMVTFSMDFVVQNSKKEIRGRAENTLKIRKMGNSLKILDEKQKVTDRRSG